MRSRIIMQSDSKKTTRGVIRKMKTKKSKESKKWWRIVCLLIGIIILALVLQAGILNYVNEKNFKKTSQVLLDQAISVIEKNQESEKEMIQSLKEDYIVRAKAVSYMIDARPDVEYDTKELQKIAELMSIDEIHLFNKIGTIYSGTVPNYYGYSFNSGEQLSYFKPMLRDKSLTMCQDVTPNTSEGKNMMYAITWNEAGTRMVQVGIEPVRLLEEVKQNEVSTVVSNMPMYEGINIYVADRESGEIYGATDVAKVGKTLDELGMPKNKVAEKGTTSAVIQMDGEKYHCTFETTGSYVVGVTFAISSDNESNLIAMLLVAVYLGLAGVVILFMVVRVLKVNREKNEQFAVLSSMAEIYHSMYMVNLQQDSVIAYSAQGEIKETGKVYKNADAMMHQIMAETALEAYHEQADRFADLHTVAERMKGKKIISGEFVGKTLGWFRASFIRIEADQENRPVKAIFTIQSIDDEKRKEEKLIQTSNTDELTGCLNRRAYEKDISDLSGKTEFIYISMDVNGLKIINDSLGHAAGDELLQGASFCMKECFDHYGNVYRIGGDEFVAILFTDQERLEEILERFDEMTGNWSGRMIESLTISYGIVSSTEQLQDPEGKLSVSKIAKTADIRMYERKAMYYRNHGVDRRGQPAAYVALCKLYSKILKINLTDDNYRILSWDDDGTEENGDKTKGTQAELQKKMRQSVRDSIGKSAHGQEMEFKLSKWLKNLEASEQIHPEDLQEYQRKTDLQFLRERFDQDRRPLSISFRRKAGEEYQLMTIEIVPGDEYSVEKQVGFLYVKG